MTRIQNVKRQPTAESLSISVRDALPEWISNTKLWNMLYTHDISNMSNMIAAPVLDYGIALFKERMNASNTKHEVYRRTKQD